MDLLIIALGDHDTSHALTRVKQGFPDGAPVALDLVDHDVAGAYVFQFDDELPGPVLADSEDVRRPFDYLWRSLS
jgi:hypothetical protein